MKKVFMKRNKTFLITAFILTILSLSSVNFIKVQASTPQRGIITLTFDDGTPSQYDTAFPLMQARGIHGTFYVNTGYCPTQDWGGTTITIPQLLEMQTAGNEIGSHSVTHPDFTTLSDEQINCECLTSKQYLLSNGINVNNFAYPYGTGDLSHANTIVSKYYRSARGIWYTPVTLPYTQFQLPAQTSEGINPYFDKLAFLKNRIDSTITSNLWTIFIFHNVVDLQSAITYGGISVQDFTCLLDYLVVSGVNVLTINEALNIGETQVPEPVPEPVPIPEPITTEFNVGDIIRNIYSSEIGTITAYEGQYNSGISWFMVLWTIDGCGIPECISYGIRTNDMELVLIPPIPTLPTSTQIVVTNVTASSYDGNAYSPNKAVDGIESSSNYWASAYLGSQTKLPQWLQLDLGQQFNINKITTHFWDDETWLEPSKHRIYTYFIQSSNDGVVWSTIISEKPGQGSMTDTFSSITARYVRITVTGNTANNNAHIEEVKVYGYI